MKFNWLQDLTIHSHSRFLYIVCRSGSLLVADHKIKIRNNHINLQLPKNINNKTWLVTSR